MRVKLAIPVDSKPGQIYDANLQCELMHGVGYQQVGRSPFSRWISQLILLENCFAGSLPFSIKARTHSWKRPFHTAPHGQRDLLEINHVSLQITPRVDSADGICYMMWCGQSSFGRIITSHPALEG